MINRLSVKLSSLAIRIQSKYQRTLAAKCFRRPIRMRNTVPLISFTFDDFPRSALTVAGEILNRYGVAGTYYASLGLMGKHASAGKIFEEQDLALLLKQGHELGCHTFDHFNAWETKPQIFEDSVAQNRRALQQILPEARFRSLSYPKLPPRPLTKRRVGRQFTCCRCGGQKLNSEIVDSNHLWGFFLEKSRDNLDAVKELIDRNRKLRGWLIFATHDVCEEPSPYGCTPGFFEEVVRYSVSSGAQVLPVVKAWESLSHNGSRLVHQEGRKGSLASTSGTQSAGKTGFEGDFGSPGKS